MAWTAKALCANLETASTAELPGRALSSITGGGGRHVLFKIALRAGAQFRWQGWRATSDIRGDGGYINSAAVRSTRPAGQYHWSVDSARTFSRRAGLALGENLRAEEKQHCNAASGVARAGRANGAAEG